MLHITSVRVHASTMLLRFLGYFLHDGDKHVETRGVLRLARIQGLFQSRTVIAILELQSQILQFLARLPRARVFNQSLARTLLNFPHLYFCFFFLRCSSCMGSGGLLFTSYQILFFSFFTQSTPQFAGKLILGFHMFLTLFGPIFAGLPRFLCLCFLVAWQYFVPSNTCYQILRLFKVRIQRDAVLLWLSYSPKL